MNYLDSNMSNKCIENLIKHGFETHFYSDSDLAKKFILSKIERYQTFGFPGSHTIRKLGLPEELKKRGKIVLDHWDKSLGTKEIEKIKLDQGRSDCLLCSANAIASTGEIVNVDGYGNRVAGSIIGPKKVIIVAGTNKITQTVETALERVRLIAAPIRAKEIGVKTPCAKTGVCENCNSPQRICRVTVILHRKPINMDISVVLIDEHIGH